MSQFKQKSHKKLYIIILAALLLIGGTVTFAWWHQSRRSETRISVTDTDKPKTTSPVQSAQSDFTSDDTTKQTGSSSTGSGGITDTNGTTATPSNSGAVITSSNGEISVYAPAKNAILANGSVISGSSTLSKVFYRINDTDNGMIATGSLSVVDGKFSGSIQFNTSSTDGQLDFYATQSNGNEYANVSIPVRFK